MAAKFCRSGRRWVIWDLQLVRGNSKDDIKDAKPSGYGHFVTLWKKQGDGSWRFVVDLGISHPESGGPLSIWKVGTQVPPKSFKAVDVVKATDQLIERDRSYGTETTKSVAMSFLKYAASEVRLYLPGQTSVDRSSDRRGSTPDERCDQISTDRGRRISFW